AGPLLIGAGEVARHVHQGHDRDREGVAEAHETAGLLPGLDVQCSRHLRGLVGDDPDRSPFDPAEADDDVRREQRLHLEEVPVVDDVLDHRVDVVGLVGGVGDDGVEGPVGVGRLEREGGLVRGELGHVVVGEEAEEGAGVVDRVVLVLSEVVRHTGTGVVGVGAAELLHADVLARDRLDHVGAGHEHLARLVHHDHEVGQRGAVDRAAGRWAHDDGDLRDHAGGAGVQTEDLAVLAEGEHPLLDAGAPGVEDSHDRDAAAERELHDLDDLLAGDLAERSAEGREVLRVDGDGAAVDRGDAGDHGVAVGAGPVHAERGGAVAHVLVELDEAAGVDEQVDALAGRHLALRVLLLLRDLLRRDDGLVVARAQ
ncbi:hypothetical protein ABE10_00765, partial [Bacillus toyonensis]|nr:hypothetical protein [Bacillus toyonensis]